jgi:hypothetical protein
MERACNQCGIYKELNADNFRETLGADKTIYFRKICAICEKEYKKQWKKDNKERLKENNRKYEQSIPVKLKKILLQDTIKIHGSKNAAIINDLPYTMEDLQAYVEAQFLHWVNWDNYGSFRKNWDDADSSTWTWRIYHKIRHEDFYERWQLSNIIILSSKEILVVEANLRERKCDCGEINKERFRKNVANICIKCEKEKASKNIITYSESKDKIDIFAASLPIKYKTCTGKCKKNKILNKDNFRIKKAKIIDGIVANIYFDSECRVCAKERDDNISPEKLREKCRRRYKKDRARFEGDPEYRKYWTTRNLISRAIYDALKNSGSSKYGDSSIEKLKYTIDELNSHINVKFEWWMTWDNRGKYNKKTWKDDAPSTWVWNLDHIIPQSDLPYTSMDDENFKKCWALENLRPYSAKQNIIDGVTRVRHKK